MEKSLKYNKVQVTLKQINVCYGKFIKKAENSFTHRHMCEFVDLDIQMIAIKEYYFKLLDFFGELFPSMFQQLFKKFDTELKAINEQFEFEPFKCKQPVVKLTFEEVVALLKENGIDRQVIEDLSTEIERKLVRQKYDTDLYMLHRYPVKPDHLKQQSVKMIQDSPVQKIHSPVVLEERAI